MEKEKFYITTAIAYTSGTPHIGNVYEAILADSIARYKRKKGFDVFFQTGTDEHGEKIEEKAKNAGITPQEHVDNISNIIKNIYHSVDISYDYFVRTTDDYHVEEVQNIFKKFYDQGDIYKGYYEGHYCKACESFFLEKDLVDGKCPDCGGAVYLEKEEAYFFKMSKYQDRLLEHINTHPNFIQPEARKNEMINNFLSAPLPDLCVSRTSHSWGVPVTFDSKHVVYVWIDALSNYITSLGYHSCAESNEKFKKYWPADLHLIGKDILRFHTIYWPIMLMALDLPLPTQVFGHPWILFGHDKMSKSKGNLIYTDELVNKYGCDAVRYFVLHDTPFASDGNISHELIIERINSDLVNTLGNLLSRSVSMASKYFDGVVKYSGTNTIYDKELEEMAKDTYNSYCARFDKYEVSYAIEEVIKFLRRANKYVDETMPWVLAKDETKKDELSNVIYHLLESLRIAAALLEPIMPQTCAKILNQIGANDMSFDSLADFGKTNTYHVGEKSNLFNRIEVEKNVPAVEEKKEVIANPITIDDFAKIDLVVGKILEASAHPNAEKLLVLKVDIKTSIRTIVSGIAKYYKPEDIVGKKVVVVKNLAEAELRGIKSEGMLLCASKKDKVELIEVKDLEIGSKVS